MKRVFKVRTELRKRLRGGRKHGVMVDDRSFSGYMDEFRVSNTARWERNHTPVTDVWRNEYLQQPVTSHSSQVIEEYRRRQETRNMDISIHVANRGRFIFMMRGVNADYRNMGELPEPLQRMIFEFQHNGFPEGELMRYCVESGLCEHVSVECDARY